MCLLCKKKEKKTPFKPLITCTLPSKKLALESLKLKIKLSNYNNKKLKDYNNNWLILNKK